jgi:hypothetical protein
MKLADLRKLAIRRQFRIRFALRNGMECVVDQHGVARVPALKSVPDFDLETELAAANQFLLDPVPAAPGKDAPKARPASRDELTAMADASPSAPAPAHDDE